MLGKHRLHLGQFVFHDIVVSNGDEGDEVITVRLVLDEREGLDARLDGLEKVLAELHRLCQESLHKVRTDLGVGIVERGSLMELGFELRNHKCSQVVVAVPLPRFVTVLLFDTPTIEGGFVGLATAVVVGGVKSSAVAEVVATIDDLRHERCIDEFLGLEGEDLVDDSVSD